MSAEKASLVNKLILVVLVSILACLVVLVARHNAAKRDATRSYVAQPVTEETLPSEPPSHLPLTSRAPRKAAADVTQPAAAGLIQQPAAGSLEVNPPADAHQLASAPLVNLPSHSPAPASSGSLANGAEIAGYVWLTGTPPPETQIALDATCGRLHSHPITTRHYVRSDDGRLANVFVYIKTALQDRHFAAPTNAAVLDNVGCLFEPYVLGVRTGQKIQFRNSDPLMHNVHATAQANREFNFALARKNQSVEKAFGVPEVFVRIKCDVHPWMFAYVGVVRHPFFAVTDHEGVYRLPLRVPPGYYTFAAVHPKAGEVSQDVEVNEGGRLRLDFRLATPARP